MPVICKAWIEESQGCDLRIGTLLLMAQLYDRRNGFYTLPVGSADKQSNSDRWQVRFVVMNDRTTKRTIKVNDAAMIGSYDTKAQARDALRCAAFGAAMLDTRPTLAKTKQ